MNISEHRGYSTWLNMMQRCYNKTDARYKNYGARGIKVCDEWHDAKVFCKYFDETKQDASLTHDRIDNNGNYEPSNCRWVSRTIQQQNRRYAKENTQTGFKGVRKNKNSFQARIHIDKKCKTIGTYKTPEEAAMAYDTFIIIYGLNHTQNFK